MLSLYFTNLSVSYHSVPFSVLYFAINKINEDIWVSFVLGSCWDDWYESKDTIGNLYNFSYIPQLDIYLPFYFKKKQIVNGDVINTNPHFKIDSSSNFVSIVDTTENKIKKDLLDILFKVDNYDEIYSISDYSNVLYIRATKEIFQYKLIYNSCLEDYINIHNSIMCNKYTDIKVMKEIIGGYACQSNVLNLGDETDIYNIKLYKNQEDVLFILNDKIRYYSLNIDLIRKHFNSVLYYISNENEDNNNLNKYHTKKYTVKNIYDLCLDKNNKVILSYQKNPYTYNKKNQGKRLHLIGG